MVIKYSQVVHQIDTRLRPPFARRDLGPENYKSGQLIGRTHWLYGGDYDPNTREFLFNTDVFGLEGESEDDIRGFRGLEAICKRAGMRDIRNSLLLVPKNLIHYELTSEPFGITREMLKSIREGQYASFQRKPSSKLRQGSCLLLFSDSTYRDWLNTLRDSKLVS